MINNGLWSDGFNWRQLLKLRERYRKPFTHFCDIFYWKSDDTFPWGRKRIRYWTFNATFFDHITNGKLLRFIICNWHFSGRISLALKSLLALTIYLNYFRSWYEDNELAVVWQETSLCKFFRAQKTFSNDS